MHRLLPILLLFAGLACASPDRASNGARHDANDTFSWVWILTGPRDSDVQGEARSAAFSGHFSNMKRMAEDGEMLVAGPLGKPLVHADHRGIFVLTTSDPEEALRVANSDPTAQAGVFQFEVEPFSTSDELERLTAMHTAATADVEAPPPGYHCRLYVLVTGRPAAAAERVLDRAPVLFAGRLGTGADERALACLDATAAEEALAFLPAGDVQWTAMGWYATEEIVNLRGAR